MEKKSIYNIRYTMRKEDVMTFVSGLHDMQAGRIEEAVAVKEKQGFPEAMAVIKHIQALR